MKRIAVLGALAFLVLGFSAPRANATLVCVAPVGFCDRIELEINLGGVIAGNYDHDCTDTFSTPLVGRLGGGHATASGAALFAPPPTAMMLDHVLATALVDFWVWDGVTLTNIAPDVPYTVTPGACPLSAVEGAAGRPRGSAD